MPHCFPVDTVKFSVPVSLGNDPPCRIERFKVDILLNRCRARHADDEYAKRYPSKTTTATRLLIQFQQHFRLMRPVRTQCFHRR